MNINKRFMGKLIDSKLLSKDENGNVKCRWCQKPVLPPRRTMCSANCAHEIKLRCNGKYLRECVYKRDKGVCAICNIDTTQIAKTTLSYKTETSKLDYLKEMDISPKRKIWKRKYGGGLWDADHIVPVKDGGGQCGLENLRTLCIKCHKAVSFSSSAEPPK